jgi:uncharacterized protein YndB with AHSA1/START domain
MERTIKLKQCFPYPVENVWNALTDPNLLGKWFMENDLQPVIGREFTFRMAPQKGWDGITYCKVIELVPMQKISYTYKGSASGEKALACAGIHSETADSIGKGIFTELDTVLTFTLETTCGGSCLTMEHSGYKGLKLVLVSFIMGMGWKKQLRKRLPLVLERMSKGNVVHSTFS